MHMHTHRLISWTSRKAKRFYNLFISANPDVCNALYYDSTSYLYGIEGDPWVWKSRRRKSARKAHKTGKDALVRDTTLETIFAQSSFNASASLPTVPHGALRPPTQRLLLPVSDAGIYTLKTVSEQAHETDARRVRRRDRILSWPMMRKANNVVQADDVDIRSPIPHREDEVPTDNGVLDFDSRSHTAARCTYWHTHDEVSSNHFQHACIRSFDSTLDSIDEDNILHVYSSPYSPNYLSGFEDYNVSTPPSYCGDAIAQKSLVASPRCRLNSPRPPIPSLMLTLPTPALPQTPIFAVQSPITVSKYISASSTLGPEASRSTDCLTTAPSAPRASCCGLAEFDAGTQCSTCDQQWLACKIWYQANDGGRKRLLTEPYVKPAESNARTRAIEDALGVPGGLPHPSALGLGIEFETETPRKRRFWRLSKLLTTMPLPEHVLDTPVPQPSNVVNEKMDFKILLFYSGVLGKTSTTCLQLKSKIISLFNRVKLQWTDPSGRSIASRDSDHCGLLSANLDGCKSSTSDVARTVTSSVSPVERWDDDFDIPSERVLSGSKFVEHLVVFPADLDGVS